MQNTQAINVTAGNATATGSVTVSDNMPGVPCPDPAGYKYVGARYVPLFADPAEWNINSSYEPLTIVLYQGNSYTSRQFVPAGIEITNKEYWAETGNYNAQIEQYRQEVHQLSEDVTETKGDVEANTSAIAAEQEARENADTIIKADIESTKKRKLGYYAVVIGNSYTLGANVEKGMGKLIGEYFEKSSYYYMDGVGFAPYSVGEGALINTNTFNDVVNNAYTALGADECNDVSDVFIVMAMGDSRYASYNDLTNEYINYVRTVIDNINSKFPNATVHVMNAEIKGGFSQTSGYTTMSDVVKVNTFFDNYYQSYKIDWLGMLSWSPWFRFGFTQDDNYHPTDQGYSYLITAFYNAMHRTLKHEITSSFRCSIRVYTSDASDFTDTSTSNSAYNFISSMSIDKGIALATINTSFITTKNISKILFVGSNTPKLINSYPTFMKKPMALVISNNKISEPFAVSLNENTISDTPIKCAYIADDLNIDIGNSATVILFDAGNYAFLG